jgi:hypothetical protein
VKGPGLRNDLEIRRTFRCPQCGRTALKLGDVVSLSCACTDPPTWMQIQPEPKKTIFKFEKVEIPLTDEDLVIRDRPRRMPPPPPEGAPENANDRRNVRPKRPKPERRSFESFQEDLAAKVESESVEVDVVGTQVSENTELIVEAPAPRLEQVVDSKPSVPTDDEFGEGL